MTALPPIVQTGHPVLRRGAQTVPDDMLGSAELKSLVRTMVEVMRAAPGVGLAAPQIGVPLRVAVLEDGPELTAKLSESQLAERERTPLPLTVLVNPVLTTVEGAGRAMFFEGCLSVAGFMALVERDLAVEVNAVDAEGAPVHLELRGWPARIAQHEVDHLDGSLYIDRMIVRSFCNNRELMAHWIGKSIDDIRAALKA